MRIDAAVMDWDRSYLMQKRWLRDRVPPAFGTINRSADSPQCLFHGTFKDDCHSSQARSMTWYRSKSRCEDPEPEHRAKMPRCFVPPWQARPADAFPVSTHRQHPWKDLIANNVSRADSSSRVAWVACVGRSGSGPGRHKLT